MSALVIGETRSRVAQLLRLKGRDPENLVCLDNFSDKEIKQLLQRLRALPSPSDVVLFSDGGMPILFDPGVFVLQECKTLGFSFRTKPVATSWGTAMVVSGYQPPFWIEGFLAQKKEERQLQWRRLSSMKQAVVLLETPYRIGLLAQECVQNLPSRREVFVGWQISSAKEDYFWVEAAKLPSVLKERGCDKGECIFILGPTP
jgi:16S rRNA (cytidine1402-2'-O)-methyltransferase